MDRKVALNFAFIGGLKMLNDVQEKILLNERKELLNQIKARDEVIDFLLDELESEHMGSRAVYNKEIFKKWDLKY